MTTGEAARLVWESMGSDLPVIDDDGGLVGLLCEGDLLRAAMPKLDEETLAGSVLDAEHMLLVNGADLAEEPIDRVVIRDPILVHPDDPLLKAATVMVNRQIRRLVVAEDGRLVGMVSRADVCRGLLADQRARPTARSQ